MKKFVVLSLIALLVLAFGSMAFAQAKKEELKLEFRASGFIDAQTLYWRNVSPAAGPIFGGVPTAFLPNGTSYGHENSAIMTRGHLKFDAVYGKAMSGTIYFEMDSTRWGDGGRPAAAGRGETAGRWGGDEAAVEIKNLFFTFALPAEWGLPIPMNFTAGLQPLVVRPKVFVATDGTGFKFDARIDPATVSLYYFKALEGRDVSADDVDAYGLQASAKIGKITAGGYGFYYNLNTYPVDSSTILGAGVSPSYKADMYWLGVYADGKMGPVDVNFDFVYNRGEVEKRKAYAVAKDVKYRGWMTRAKVDFPWEKFNFGGVGVYASGADMKKTSASGLPGTTVANGAVSSSKVGAYLVPPFSENFAFGDAIVIQTEWNRAMSGFRTASGSSFNRGAFGGTWMAQLYGSFKATPWYKITFKGMYLGDTTKNGNTLGTARKTGGTLLRDDKTIGWEFDLINEINIYRNLKLDIALGYLVPGDGLEYWDSVRSKNVDPKDPYIFLTKLTYSF